MEANREFRILWFIVIAAAIIIVVVLAGMFWPGREEGATPGQEVPVPVVVQQVL